MIEVTINGDKVSLDGVMSLSDFLARLEIEQDKVAIEHNLEIVPKSTFNDLLINDGDKLEIVHFIGGG